MLIVPTKALPNQTLNATLGGQPVTLNVYQTPFGLFMDVLVAGALIIGGVLCHDRNVTVRNAYFGFIGDLSFIDTVGTEDPEYTTLGTRFVLVYLEAADLVESKIER